MPDSRSTGFVTSCAAVLALAGAAYAQEGGALTAALLGSPTTDQVYTPVNPCRFVDGITAGDRVPTAANGTTARYYRVRGSTSSDFVSQGAASSAPGGCGVPSTATAVMVNLTVADPDQDGDLRVDAAHVSTPSSTSVLNYTFGGARGKNLANGIVVPLCNLSVSACDSGATPTSPTRDILVTFHAGASPVSTFFIADVLGYFAPAPLTGLVTSVSASAPLASSGGATPNVSLTGIVPVANGGTGAATLGGLQARLIQFCSVGSAIRAIAADGTVTCETPVPAAANTSFVEGPTSLTGTAAATITSTSVTAGGPGRIIAIGSAEAYCDAGCVTGTDYVSGYVWVTSVPAGPVAPWSFFFTGTNQSLSVTRTLQFTVASAGSYTLYLRGSRAGGVGTSVGFYRGQLQLFFLPN